MDTLCGGQVRIGLTLLTYSFHEGKLFEDPDKANNYMLHNQFTKDVKVTEHIFMLPLSTTEKLN